jgi:hypothetical protein
VNTWKVILATLVIFGAGVITGGLLVSYSNRMLQTQRRPLPPPNPPGPLGRPNPGAGNRLPAPMPAPLRKAFLDRLEKELKLSAVQKERIERIISDGQERTRQAWQQVEPRMRRELMETRAQIRAELTSAQQAQFEELMKQRPREQRRPLLPRERPVDEAPASNAPSGQN